jgi:hypothetical protein
MDGITFNYSSCLGTAIWEYISENKAASTNFKVCSEAINNVDPINLLCSHNFFSKTLTTEENNKFISDLTTILNTLNVQNLEIFVIADSPLTQSILVNYEINNVEQDKVDELTTTIASVCKKGTEDISLKNNCSNKIGFVKDNGSTSVESTCNYIPIGSISGLPDITCQTCDIKCNPCLDCNPGYFIIPDETVIYDGPCIAPTSCCGKDLIVLNNQTVDNVKYGWYSCENN